MPLLKTKKHPFIPSIRSILSWLNKAHSLPQHLEDRRRNNFLLIRLAAAILVIVAHCYRRSDPIYLLSGGLLNGTTIAMPVFFFLSGLLVSQSLDHCPSRINYLWRRFLRLYPAAFFTVLLTSLVIGPLVTVLPIRTYFSDPLFCQYLRTTLLIKIYFWLPGVFIHSPLGRSVNSAIWSLALEIKLYIALLLLSFIRNRNLTRFLLIFSVVVFLALGTFHGYFEPMLGKIFVRRFFLYAYSDLAIYFAAGVLTYSYRHKIVVRNYWVIGIPFIWLITRHLLLSDLFSLLLLPPMILYVAVTGTRTLSRITPSADLSYGLFLWGFPIEQLIINYISQDNLTIRFAGTLLGALLLAFISWHFIESPALKWKNKIR